MSPAWAAGLWQQLGEDGPPLCVAYSGGADSSSLLHLLAQAPASRQRGLRALHIDHGLNPDSGRWAEAVQDFCRQWQVPCTVQRVQVDLRQGLGLEAAAREARYQAFAAALAEDELLLLAQHRDDQAETVLLKLLRGAGPDALRGMPRSRPLGRGRLLRPLLEVPGQCLREYARQQGLPVQSDPSNQDTRLARNYLRHTIMPQLQQTWPQAVDSILHAARWCGEAADALQPAIAASLQHCLDPNQGSLDAGAWQALAPALRVPVLHEWLHRQGLPAPSTAQRAQIEQQLQALPGRVPLIRWPGAKLHIWRQRLWASAPRPPAPAGWRQPWRGEPVQLPDGRRFGLPSGSAALPPLELRLRAGGERIQLAGENIHRELRDLFQQGAVPPWQRPDCPLIYEQGQLIAVADRWLSARAQLLYQHAGEAPGWQ